MFATIADSHIRADRTNSCKYLKATAIAPELLATYVADINDHDPPVDFVVHLGDVVDTGKPEEFRIASEILSCLRCPLYPVAGNHDDCASNNQRLWRRFAQIESSNYGFDVAGFHFLAIDCTVAPYGPPYVECGEALRQWITEDLIVHYDEPTIVFSHYNLIPRYWSDKFNFDSVTYGEYLGVRELRHILECAGNVVGVINGHVHANRHEVRHGIHYIDVGATLVGPPSIRYFYVYPDTIRVEAEYISDQRLLGYVTALCRGCCGCFDPTQVCEFIDGRETDRAFSVPVRIPTRAARGPDGRPIECHLAPTRQGGGIIEFTLECDLYGPAEFSLHGRQGAMLSRLRFDKLDPTEVIEARVEVEGVGHLAEGTYYARLTLEGYSWTQRFNMARLEW